MLRLSLLVLAAAAAAGAQSPLTTLFASDNSGAMGGGIYFDLTASAPVVITQLDLNLSSPAATPGTIELWVLPGQSHVGNENSNSSWTRLGTGAVTAAGVNTRSIVTFAPGLALACGLNGVAVCAIGVAHAYTNGTGSNQTYTNAELTLRAGSALNMCFAAGSPFTPRVVNCSLHYTVGAGICAAATPYGTGCPNGSLSFYEEFPPAAFDLAGNPTHSIRLTPAGGGYAVTVGSNSFVAPTSSGLALGDDTVSGALALPGAGLTFPGGSTAQIVIASNGYVWLQGTGTVSDFSPTAGELLSSGPRLCAMWGDLVPDGPANVANCYYDVVGSIAYCTWLNVPEFGGGTAANTFQIAIDTATHTIELTWQACGLALAGHNMIAGFSPGAANRNPGSRDISATLPFATQGSDAAPLTQTSTRPILATTAMLTVSNIPSGSVGGVQVIGAVQNPGIALSSFNMPGCFLHALPWYFTLPFNTTSSSATTSLPIPGTPSLRGAVLAVTAVTVSPGVNAANLASANGVQLTLAGS